MADIIDFSPKKKAFSTTHMLDLTISSDTDGLLEVSCQISEGYSDYEVFEALVAAAYKYAEDCNLMEDETIH